MNLAPSSVLAQLECGTNSNGIAFNCAADGSAELVISASALTDNSSLFAYVEAPLSVRNTGHLTYDGMESFLALYGNEISYRGDGASIFAPAAKAIAAYSLGSGATSFVLNDVITGQFGLFAQSVSGGALDIVMTGGSIAGEVGIQVNQMQPGRVDITVQSAATIDAATPILVDNVGATRLVLAGKLAGTGDTGLGIGSSELELHPGFAVAGTIHGLGGENTLIWGGDGQGSFDLDRVGSHVDDDGVETGQYFGFQHFRKSGPSNWTLSGSLIEAFDLDIDEGSLTFDNASAELGLTTISSHGRLAGSGSLGDLDVFGTLAPRGTLLAGDVVFHPGSLLEVTASTVGADVLRVASVGDLSETTLQVAPSVGYAGGQPILIADTAIAAGNRFAVIRSTTRRYRPELTYAGNQIILDLVATGAHFAGFARNPAEASIADLLDAMGPAAPYYDALDTMGAEDVSRLLAQLSGSDLSATGEALLQNAGLLDTAVIGRLQQQAGMLGPSEAPLGYASLAVTPESDPSTGAWGKLVTGTATASGTVSGATAILAGADTTLSNGATFGLLAGLGQSAVSSGTTAAKSADLSIGTYAAAELAGVQLRLGTSFTHHAIASSRHIQSPGVDARLTADYSILTAQVFAELAHQLDLGPLTAELFTDLGYARNFTSAYTEKGGAGALSVAASTSDAIETQLGARFSQKFAVQTALVTLAASLALKCRLATTQDTLQSFSGSAAFTIPGAADISNGLVAGLDIKVDQSDDAGLDVSYRLELGDAGTAQTISARYARLL